MKATAAPSGEGRHVAVAETAAASSVEIRRSPEDVFDYCSDYTREPEWNPGARRVERRGEGPAGVGTRYRMEYVHGHPMVAVCAGFDRPVLWTMVGRSHGVRFEFGGEVRATHDGARLTLRMRVQPPELRRFAAPLLRRHVQSELDRNVDAIKAILEGDLAPLTTGGAR